MQDQSLTDWLHSLDNWFNTDVLHNCTKQTCAQAGRNADWTRPRNCFTENGVGLWRAKNINMSPGQIDPSFHSEIKMFTLCQQGAFSLYKWSCNLFHAISVCSMQGQWSAGEFIILKKLQWKSNWWKVSHMDRVTQHLDFQQKNILCLDAKQTQSQIQRAKVEPKR